jgi:hypothetical protein
VRWRSNRRRGRCVGKQGARGLGGSGARKPGAFLKGEAHRKLELFPTRDPKQLGWTQIYGRQV